MSTFLPRNRTPSASRRNRCSIAESPVNLIAPPAPKTRCQGKPKPRRKTRATIRAAPGYPAVFATAPYVDTFPSGIARIARSIRNRIFPAGSDFFLRFFISKRNRPARRTSRPASCNRLTRRFGSPVLSRSSRQAILTPEFLSANFDESSRHPERLQRVVLRLVHFKHR